MSGTCEVMPAKFAGWIDLLAARRFLYSMPSLDWPSKIAWRSIDCKSAGLNPLVFSASSASVASLSALRMVTSYLVVCTGEDIVQQLPSSIKIGKTNDTTVCKRRADSLWQVV
jgi:hypothetical protein